MTSASDRPKRPGFWIESATFSDGTTISFHRGDIIVLVGPNNVGKSVALENIDGMTQDRKKSGVVVTDTRIAVEGDANSVVEWLSSTIRKTLREPSNPTYTRMRVSVVESNAQSWWARYKEGLHRLSRFFVCRLTTEGRLSAANPPENIALTRDPFTHPIHYLQDDDTIEKRTSEYFRKTFGQDLVVHRNAGNEVPLLCGEKPTPRNGEDRVSVAYQRALEKLPTLQSQGDGMRAFVGVLLHTLVVDHAVVLIDEPEAFLHPPQARVIGQMLVGETSPARQLFLATHSGDFLRGLLDLDSTRVKIVRINRKGNVNHVRELNNEGIREVWRDPILRYSKVLDGLFHRKVIVCEGDADCRFYAAIRDVMSEDGDWPESRNVMFTHCGGKDRIPVVVRALRSLDVPVAVIADFDVLNAEQPIHSICEALGGRWEKFEADWKCVSAAVSQKKPELKTADVRREVNGLLDDVKEKVLPKTAAEAIREVVRKSSPWSLAKAGGLSFVPSGEPTKACKRLLADLRQLGLFVVEVGELEGFMRSVGWHGPKWVNEVLDRRGLLNDPELREAREFVRAILEEHAAPQ